MTKYMYTRGVICIHQPGPKNQTLVIKHGSMCLYTLNYFGSPRQNLNYSQQVIQYQMVILEILKNREEVGWKVSEGMDQLAR